MKLFNIIKKNFKIILRGKTSGFIVFLGPLLIVLLVGLFFNGKSNYDLSIGYFTPEKTDLTQSFISSLKNTSFIVQEFKDELSCTDKIKQGVMHTCIIFPVDFEVGNNNKNELRFIVDYSKINLVYKIIDSVSGILNSESKEVSYSLTSLLISKINTTLCDIKDDIADIEVLEIKTVSAASSIESAESNAREMKLEMADINLANISNDTVKANASLFLLKNESDKLLSQNSELIDQLDDYLNATEIENLNADLADLNESLLEQHNHTANKVSVILDDIEKLENDIIRLESDLATSNSLNEDTKMKLNSAKQELEDAKVTLTALKESLFSSKSSLEGINVNRAEAIVSPVNTKIEPITADSSNTLFTFPFLLVLTIMFVALFLSSTLSVFEKNSKAQFRNFITPTKQGLFVFALFFTGLIILVVQAMVILFVADKFLQVHAFANALPVILIVVSLIIFFISAGMLIGRFFSTHEGAVMVSIILSSIFLFASNLVVPLESLAPALSSVIKYNPYIVSSELLRKALLFNLSIRDALPKIAVLLGLAVIFLAIILISNSRHKKKYVSSLQKPAVGETGFFQSALFDEADGKCSRVFEFKGKKASNKEELLNIVSSMTRAEYEDNVNSYENKIVDWVFEGLKDRKLASQLRKASSREELVKILSAVVKKHKSEPDEKDRQE